MTRTLWLLTVVLSMGTPAFGQYVFTPVVPVEPVITYYVSPVLAPMAPERVERYYYFDEQDNSRFVPPANSTEKPATQIAEATPTRATPQGGVIVREYFYVSPPAKKPTAAEKLDVPPPPAKEPELKLEPAKLPPAETEKPAKLVMPPPTNMLPKPEVQAPLKADAPAPLKAEKPIEEPSVSSPKSAQSPADSDVD